MSIKTKLITGISVLFVIVFAIAAFLFIGEKRTELTHDMYTEARSFAVLSTPKIIELYDTYLAESGFLLFNREINDIFKMNEDIAKIRVVNFAGELLYDSETEKAQQWIGDARQVQDNELLKRIKAVNPSVLLDDGGRVVYLKRMPDGTFRAVDDNEVAVAEIEEGTRVVNIVQPHANEFAVAYDLTYVHLNARIAAMTMRIVYLFIFSVLLGLAFGYYFSSRITNPLKKLTSSAVILGQGDFKERVTIETSDEVGILGETFNHMAEDLERSTKLLVDKERMQKELQIAAKIQAEILPKQMPNMPGLDVAAWIVPAAEIGGDCYDFVDIGGGKHFLYIGDVTGHGVPSGIVVAIANALLYSYAGLGDLQKIAKETNHVLKNKTSANMFMTLLLAMWNGTKLDYVSAGHEEMVKYEASTKKVSAVPGGGIALGMIPDVADKMKLQSLNVRSGDVVVLYSDGLTEMWSVKNEMYGHHRLKRAVMETAELPGAEAIAKAIMADVQQFAQGAEQKDDVTLVVLKGK